MSFHTSPPSNDRPMLIITWPRVFRRVDNFFPLNTLHDFEMSWDRIIQDSDEEELFVEDEVSTSIDPIQGHEPPVHDALPKPTNRPANHNTDHASGSINTPELQLGVDFDQFLQSQNTHQPSITSSQQQREERWIPSTADGGESIGMLIHDHEAIIGPLSCRSSESSD